MEDQIEGLISRWKQSVEKETEKESAGVKEFLSKQGLEETSFRFVVALVQVKVNVLSQQAPLLLQGFSAMIETGAIKPSREEFQAIGKTLIQTLAKAFEDILNYLSSGRTGAIGENKIYDIESSKLAKKKDEILQDARQALKKLGIKTAGTAKEKIGTGLKKGLIDTKFLGFRLITIILAPIIVLASCIGMILILYPPSTTRSHWGTTKLFSKAILSRNVGEMKKYCIEDAVKMCQPVLDHIRYVERERDSSGLSLINRVIGSPDIDSANVRLKLINFEEVHFMNVDMTLKKTEDNRWYINAMGSFVVEKKEEEEATRPSEPRRGNVNLVMRSIGNALEQYYLDWEAYPASLPQLTTPISYIPYEEMKDPLSLGELIQYSSRGTSWTLWSVGMDRADDRAFIIYDATNGAVSKGDIVTTGP